MFTANERKVLKFLMTSFNQYSINEIAKECGLTPNGAFKILKKLEKLDIIYPEAIGNIKIYKVNFGNTLTLSYLEVALTDERICEPKVKIRIKDMDGLRKACLAAVLFGSYITGKKDPKDIDVLFILEKDKFSLYKKKLDEAREIIPYKVHDIIQTQRDLVNNLKEQDKIIINILRKGIVLWGNRILARSIKNAKT
ncbi:nucleotidyltransferase domain-containing protein [Candidatus Woesearchaeota archaeon]|nr:nucleotidyltransferase domain-containing protein [Candidatus Woesearchaeota archaeon]